MYEHLDIRVEQIQSALPSGSGINGDWEIRSMSAGWFAQNYYHPIKADGSYESDVAYFVVFIPRNDVNDFSFDFIGQVSRYLAEEYGLHEYLEDTIAEGLRTLRRENIWTTTQGAFADFDDRYIQTSDFVRESGLDYPHVISLIGLRKIVARKVGNSYLIDKAQGLAWAREYFMRKEVGE